MMDCRVKPGNDGEDTNFKQPNTVIASVSEAIHCAATEEWIASSRCSSQ
jgi:hypothetical protein